jgi:ATP-dependent Lon protease
MVTTRSQNKRKFTKTYSKSDKSDESGSDESGSDESGSDESGSDESGSDELDNMSDDIDNISSDGDKSPLTSENKIFHKIKLSDLLKKKIKSNLKIAKNSLTQYKRIHKIIKKRPTVNKLLKMNIPLKKKCDIMERILILNNMDDETFEHMCLKNSIKEQMEKYSNKSIDYEKLDKLENDIKNINIDLPLQYKILTSDMPLDRKFIIYNKYKYLDQLSESNSEYPKLLNWIETALNIPNSVNKIGISITDGSSKISEYLFNIKTRLDSRIYGLESVKEQILLIVNNMITNPKYTGINMALVGPQGVGKTEITQILAETINLPFTQIALGGSNDSSFLSGYGYTYEGSTPGAIATGLIKMKQLNGIILFDELDKLTNNKFGNEVSKILLHITDSTQNHEFKDKYLGNELPMNLSNIWFVYSLNYIEALDRTLRDRLHIIEIKGYTKKEKKEIAGLHLIPKELKNLGMEAGDITFSNKSLEYIIDYSDEKYTRETKDKDGKSGVRQLKYIICNIIMKLNMIRNCTLPDGKSGLNIDYYIENFKLPFVVKTSHIKKLNVFAKPVQSEQLSMYL